MVTSRFPGILRIIIAFTIIALLIGCGGGGGSVDENKPESKAEGAGSAGDGSGGFPDTSGPIISDVNGTVSHGRTITLSGSGFGKKSSGPPVVWDNCSGTDPLVLWGGNYNSEAEYPYRGHYTTPEKLGRGVALVHSHDAQYFAGCHYSGSGAYTSYNVGLWISRDNVTLPAYEFASWYQRIDPEWDWAVDPSSHNFKIWDWSSGATPYNQHWYLERQSAAGSDGIDIHGDDGYTVDTYYGTIGWPDEALGWHKYEMEVCFSNDPALGYVKLWVDARLQMEWNGSTDGGPYWHGSSRCTLIGGYTNAYGRSTQWRYFDDLYVDYTAQRVILGDSSTWEKCTKLHEIQIPVAWSDTSITVTVNQGVFAKGATAYLYVFDGTGTPNSKGYPVTFKSS